MKRIFILFILILIAVGVTAWYYNRPEEPVAENVTEAVVNFVIDGDSLNITYDGQEEKLRLIGIDAPERYNPDNTDNEQGRIAQDYAKKAFPQGTVIYIELGEQERDNYGRLLGYVYRDKAATQMFNLEMIEQGYAVVLTFEPNDKYEDMFIRAEQKAKQEGAGFWKE
ncbi:MAG: thermonuclease family protein [Firmicutes bacterium]|nr:thermonuclease family protein [Bacillota bacterium]